MNETGAGDEAGDSTDGDESSAEATYGGLLGAIAYAFRASDSLLLRSYVVVGTLLAALVSLLFLGSVIVLIGGTVGTTGGTFTFSRAFVILVGLFVVGPLLAPIVSTARRHRYRTATRRTDAVVAVLGYLVIVAVYVALLISAPPELRDPAGGVVAPFVEALYALPPTAAAVPLLGVALATYAIWHVHRRDR